MLGKLGLAAVVGTLAGTAAPVSAREHVRADAYWRHRELERREQWEQARRANAWRYTGYGAYGYNPYRAYVVPRHHARYYYRAW